MNRQQAIAHVHLIWPEEPAGALCVAVVDLLASGVLKRLTFSQLHKLAHKTAATELDIARAVQYLTGSELHMLDMEFEYIDDADALFYFGLREINEARRDGALYHPDSGELIEDYEEKIFVTFVPSELAKEIEANE